MGFDGETDGFAAKEPDMLADPANTTPREELMKIGILTFHFSTNYGAVLQAYALCAAIKQQGYAVEVIDYRPLDRMLMYAKLLFFDRKNWSSCFLDRSFSQNMQKLVHFLHFMHACIPTSAHVCYTRSGLRKLATHYDMLICGSDVIWRSHPNNTAKFDPSFFLDFVPATHGYKMSYAASVGTTTHFGSNNQRICAWLGQFDAISVRDTHSLNVLAGECGIQAVKVVDPTLLVDCTAIARPIDYDREYLLVYAESVSSAEAQLITSVAATSNLDILWIGEYDSRGIARINHIEVSPAEYIGYVLQASFVCTDFFHGVIFSLIAQKPFVAFYREKKSYKIQDVLEHIDSGQRLLDVSTISQQEAARIATAEMDYAHVAAQLAPLIHSSHDYLAHHLAVAEHRLQCSAKTTRTQRAQR
jgi:hypothetical protein